ncbi:DUF4132 domain-containing protein [Actinoalloteichus hymeniacidonis]|uniref:DUF4132 family protein n=1 Tax=Actinoalloteichus hymeniacidonis TaxID=340345 RepID=A0AAC9MY89_9PSEU|nr:DUF4132 domain-containing protein [Actinoalloteichus hymeniacidonis]AOS64153.1 putative DUF4132 family protein [Actinoalloteichus hymeniacidonis]MBB5907781.1 hypothetical protein [Actinoalloteichus hymeniacidonis]
MTATALDHPDEDALVLPASWRALVEPRRGSGSAVVSADPTAQERVHAAVTAATGEVGAVLDDPRTDSTLARAGHAMLAGEPTPLGAAVVASAMRGISKIHDQTRTTMAMFADAWTTAYGLTFAAEAAAKVTTIEVSWGSRTDPTHLQAADRPLQHWAPFIAVPRRMRALLTSVDDADYAAVVDALEPLRTGPCRAVTSYLLPTEQDWVSADCREIRREWWLLIHSVTTGEQLTTLVEGSEAIRLRFKEYLYAVLAHVGTAAAPAVAVAVDGAAWQEPDEQQRLIDALTLLPSDAAFDLALHRIAHPRMRPALLAMMRRFPARALRRLAAHAAGDSAIAGEAATLLRRHLLVTGSLRESVRAELDAESLAVLDGIEPPAPRPDTAPDSALPELLISPPWERRRKKAKPVVLTDLPTPPSSVRWSDGERQEWADSPKAADVFEWPADTDWDATLNGSSLRADQYAALLLQAPDEIAQRVLLRRRGMFGFWNENLLRAVVAKHEHRAAQTVLQHVLRDPMARAELLLPFVDVLVAEQIAAWLPPRTSMRPFALSWLDRHGLAAIPVFLPAALGKAGAKRVAAEEALRIIASGRAEAAVAMAAEWDAKAGAAVEALLTASPLDDLPARIPAVGDWLDIALLPPILLRDRPQALPDAAVDRVLVTLALSKPGRVYAGVAVVRESCNPASLAEFAWAIFQEWQTNGMPSSDGWVLTALGWIGDDETVRRLTPLIRAWPGENQHRRAVDALDVLAAIGTDVALMHLHAIAQKVKFAGLRNRARLKIDEVAAGLGLTSDQLADRLVPDCGLEEDGSLILDYGPRQFIVGFDESLTPFVIDEKGKQRKALPKPGATDDAELAPAAHARFAAMRKDVRTLAAEQVRRFESAMVLGRRWSSAEFHDFLLAHPLVWHLVRRLLWVVEEDGRQTGFFRVAEDRTLADIDDEPFLLRGGGVGIGHSEITVGVAHPLQLTEAENKAWAAVFADYEIVQPFRQFGRSTYELTDEERGAENLTRFAEHGQVPAQAVLGLASRGWERGDAHDHGEVQWMARPVPGGRRVVISLQPGISLWLGGDAEFQTLTKILLAEGSPANAVRGRGLVAFGELDAITASEVLAELTRLTTTS